MLVYLRARNHLSPLIRVDNPVEIHEIGRNIQIVATWTNIQELCSSSAGRFVYLLILDERQNILLPRLCTKVCVSGSIWFSGDSIWLSVCSELIRSEKIITLKLIVSSNWSINTSERLH